MAKAESLYLPKGANTNSVKIVPADTTTAKTLFTAGADDSDVLSIIVASDDTAAVNLELAVKRSSVAYVLTTLNIPIAAGTSSGGTVASVDLLNSTIMPGLPVNSAGKRYLPLKTGDTLEVRALVTVTAAKTVHVSAFGQDY